MSATQEQVELLKGIASGRVHVTLNMPTEGGYVSEEARAFDADYRIAADALLREREELRAKVSYWAEARYFHELLGETSPPCYAELEGQANELALRAEASEAALVASEEARKRAEEKLARMQVMFDKITPILQTIERQAEVLNRRAGDTRPAETILYELGKLKLSKVESFLAEADQKGGGA